MTMHLSAALARLADSPQGSDPSAELRDWERVDPGDARENRADPWERYPFDIEPIQRMPGRMQDEPSVLQPAGAVRRVSLRPTAAGGPWVDGGTGLERSHGEPDAISVDDQNATVPQGGGRFLTYADLEFLSQNGRMPNALEIEQMRRERGHEELQPAATAKEPVEEDFPRVLQAGGAAQPAEVVLGPDSSYLRACAERLVQAGFSYPAAAARFRRATGSRLPEGVYSRLSLAANLPHLVREAAYPRYKCGSCGTVFGQCKPGLCPVCRGHRVAADVTTNERPGAYDDTESLYRRELDTIQVDHGTNRDEPRRYLPASLADCLRKGDLLMNRITGQRAYVQGWHGSVLRATEIPTLRPLQIPQRALFGWDRYGRRVTMEAP